MTKTECNDDTTRNGSIYWHYEEDNKNLRELNFARWEYPLFDPKDKVYEGDVTTKDYK